MGTPKLDTFNWKNHIPLSLLCYCFFFFTPSYYLFLPLNLPKTTSLYDWKISPKRHFCTKAFFVFKSRNPPKTTFFYPILPAWILYCFFFFTPSYYLFLPLNLPKTTSLYDWKISPKRHFCTKAFFVFKSRNPPKTTFFDPISAPSSV